MLRLRRNLPPSGGRGSQVRDDFAEIFADGSCIRHEKSAAACAVADNGSWAAQPLRSAASSLAAELAAIGLAAKLARYSERSCVRIKSDSRQAIALIRRGLKGTDPGASLSGAEHRELVSTVDAIDKTDFVTVELAWTHEHAGTPRQEACDRAARFIARSFAWKLDEQVTDDRLADIISEEVRLRAA